MKNARIEQELLDLLSETPAQARSRVRAHFRIDAADALVLYGAGTFGRAVLRRLREAGIEPVAFADDTTEKQGRTVDGLPVFTPKGAVKEFGDRIVFAVTILNPALRFLDAKARLTTSTDARVVSFLDLASQWPEHLLPFYQYQHPGAMLTHAEEIRRAFHLWEDEESRRQFVAHLRFRLTFDYEALPENTGDNYFPADVLPPLPPEITFVDCGAYDGDTIRYFLRQQQNQFGKIFAFEPDGQNYRKLSDYVATLGSSKVQTYQAAVASGPGKLKFDPTGNSGAALSNNGTVEVDVVALQDVLSDEKGAALYVKFDVEGAEREALDGMERLIREASPTLAVSVYHRPADLWSLPLYLRSLNPAYKLFLRTQGEDGMDVICYAVPDSVS
ncbi:MAG TPA: FkbM family methyltransferase [Pyrinomonadaceae bacterium]|nr:FkbM family methyltransferase [Pyrinomonadaceae bacterium]